MARRRIDPLVAFGVPRVGGGILQQTEYQWFVNYAHTGAFGTGRTAEHPVKTLNEAIDKCVADRGDIIYVAPGSEEVTETVAFDVQGISVIAQDFGMNKEAAGENFTRKAASTFTDGPTGTLTASCRIVGLGFESRNTSGENFLIDCEESGGFSGGWSEIINCRFGVWYGAMKHGIKCIGGSGNKIVGCTFDGLFGGFGTSAIGLYNDTGGLAPDFMEITHNRFSGVGSGKYAITHESGSVPLGNLYAHNYLLPGFSGNYGAFLNNNNVASTGLAADNWLAPLANQAAAFVNMTNATFGFADNHYEEA